MESTWTIAELATTAALALADEPVQVNGRVRDQPNERLIRWYTTIGLLDPPLARRGRTALYGRRHLLQLVAVKRRQAAGRTIAQIQAELTGATDETLHRIARLPDPGDPPDAPGGAAAATPEPRRFWAADRPPRRDHAVDVDTNYMITEEGVDGAQVLLAVRLRQGVTLVLDGDRAPTKDELATIRAVAGPLLTELDQVGLIAPAGPRGRGGTTPNEPNQPNTASDR